MAPPPPQKKRKKNQQPTFFHSGEKEPGPVGVTGKVRQGCPGLGESEGAGAEEVQAGIMGMQTCGNLLCEKYVHTWYLIQFSTSLIFISIFNTKEP